ncbi:MAG: hypothetical protein AB2A00_01445, partial [Myxococcota bacterium]
PRQPTPAPQRPVSSGGTPRPGPAPQRPGASGGTPRPGPAPLPPGAPQAAQRAPGTPPTPAASPQRGTPPLPRPGVTSAPGSAPKPRPTAPPPAPPATALVPAPPLVDPNKPIFEADDGDIFASTGGSRTQTLAALGVVAPRMNVVVVDPTGNPEGFVVKALGQGGAACTLVETGGAARTELQRGTFQLVVLVAGPDVQWVRLLLAALRNSFPTIPRVACIPAGADPARALFTAGANDVVELPLVSAHVLTVRLQALVPRHTPPLSSLDGEALAHEVERLRGMVAQTMLEAQMAEQTALQRAVTAEQTAAAVAEQANQRTREASQVRVELQSLKAQRDALEAKLRAHEEDPFVRMAPHHAARDAAPDPRTAQILALSERLLALERPFQAASEALARTVRGQGPEMTQHLQVLWQMREVLTQLSSILLLG